MPCLMQVSHRDVVLHDYDYTGRMDIKMKRNYVNILSGSILRVQNAYRPFPQPV
jgi:hypothetical protein